MRSRSFSGRGRFHVKQRPQVMVRNYTFLTAPLVPAGTPFGLPSTVDTFIFGQTASLGLGPSRAVKAIKCHAITYSLDMLAIGAPPAANQAQFGVVSDCIYQDRDSPAVTSAPATAGVAFLQKSELGGAVALVEWPKRIFYRRQGYWGNFVSGVAVVAYPGLLPPVRYQTRRVKLNCLLGEAESLYHRLELTNPTAAAINLVFLVTGVLTYSIRN